MTHDDYSKHRAILLEAAAKIEADKRPGYTGGSPDVLANFKGVAEKLGLTPEQAWAVYFLKHVDAIISVMCKPHLAVSEPPLGRFSDAINYLKLGWALYNERDASKAPQRNSIPGQWKLPLHTGALGNDPEYIQRIKEAQEDQQRAREALRVVNGPDPFDQMLREFFEAGVKRPG